ncbi:MAG: MraY family glycosyltransferase, partial [Candidatus Sumerlaeota bacterium]
RMSHWSWLTVSLLLFSETLVLAVIMMPGGMKLGKRKGFVAHPGGRHIHEESTPTLGGVVIVGSFLTVVVGNILLAWLAAPVLQRIVPEVGRFLPNIPSRLSQIGAIILGAMVMFVLGLVDDRNALGPKFKLTVQVLAALLLVAAGIRIRGFLPWPWVGVAATVFWIIFITNAFNFLDNMDGLSGGVALICSVAFALNAFFAGEWFVAAIFFALVGSLLGFLRFNFFPAKVFMGDNGSLFIGYLIAALSVVATFYEPDAPTIWPVLTPVIILGVPIFDSVSVLWIRLREGRPLMQGDKYHFSHRLTDLGMSRRRAVTFIYIITAAVALAAIPLRTANSVGALAILVQTVLVFAIIYRIERRAKRLKAGEISPE